MLLQVASSILAGLLCGLLGHYVNELKLTTLSFSIAHAALAGAALGMVLGADNALTAMAAASMYALSIGLLLPRVGRYGDPLSMSFFTLFNALALFMVYLSQTTVLATVQVGGVLWGSILAVTPLRASLLFATLLAFTTYVLLFKSQLDSMLFDRKLAEAEGVDVYLHTTLILLFVGTAAALTLMITGGFLLFSLLYNPVVASAQVTMRERARRALAPIIGAVSATAGLGVSYHLDLPVGATIALTSLIVLLASATARAVVNRALAKAAAAEVTEGAHKTPR
ncbi:MAG: metal ABC transporter permease [Candidatus Nezhaarchaeota archaeon]|nr:metal ABC transporter permease [Candidatus Nezhaarchaeota archaeon]